MIDAYLRGLARQSGLTPPGGVKKITGVIGSGGRTGVIPGAVIRNCE